MNVAKICQPTDEVTRSRMLRLTKSTIVRHTGLALVRFDVDRRAVLVQQASTLVISALASPHERCQSGFFVLAIEFLIRLFLWRACTNPGVECQLLSVLHRCKQGLVRGDGPTNTIQMHLRQCSRTRIPLGAHGIMQDNASTIHMQTPLPLIPRVSPPPLLMI